MCRTGLLMAGMLLGIVALASDSPKEYDDRPEVAGIEGSWRPIKREYNGEKTEPNAETVHIYRSGTFTIDFGDGDSFRATYRIDTTQKPAHLDVNTVKLIYQIDGDTLRMARLASNALRRPQAFNDEGIVIIAYKRVK